MGQVQLMTLGHGGAILDYKKTTLVSSLKTLHPSPKPVKPVNNWHGEKH